MLGLAQAEQVAASEAEAAVAEAPVAEQPKEPQTEAYDETTKKQVSEIHEALFSADEVQAEPTGQEPGQPSAELNPVSEPAPVVEEPKVAEPDYKAEAEKLQAELDAIKKQAQEKAEEAEVFHPNPEAKAESTLQWGGVSQNKAFTSPHDAVFAALKKVKK